MKSKIGKFIFPLLSLLVFFIPVLLLINNWFASGDVIVGHDSGFSLNARYDLQKKSFTWWEDDFGKDGTYYISSQFIHVIDLVSTKLADIEGGGNGYVVFFWFSVMFFAMLPLSLYIGKKISSPYITVFLPIFFIFNFFLFQSIFIFERTKYSLLVSLPLFLYFTFLVEDKKIPLQIAAILTSITLFFFNGGGWVGAPLYGGIILAGVTFVIFISIETVIIRKFELFKRIATFFALSVILTVLLDAYSILPAVYVQMFSNESPLANIGGEQIWVGMVSAGASFLNLFRMQGIPDWYSSFSTINPNHPYGTLYLTNSFLIFLSFLIPIIAFLALLFARKSSEKRYVYYFAFLALIGMAFTSGSHPPFGWLYLYLYEHVPFFWLFRSPFYKFAPGYIFSMSLLLSFTLSLFISKIASRMKGNSLQRYTQIAFCVLIIFGWFSFHFVFFDKEIFSTWQKGFSTLVSIPPYVRDFEKWTNEGDLQDNSRILLLPPINNQWNADTYKWGYWSLEPLPRLLTNKAIVVNDTQLKDNENEIVSHLYKEIEKGDEKAVIDIAHWLNISYFFVREDAIFNFIKGQAIEGSLYENKLRKMPSIKLVKIFGPWKIYKLQDTPSQKVIIIPEIVITDYTNDYFDRVKNPSYEFTLSADGNHVAGQLLPFISKTLQRLRCVSCTLGEEKKATLISESSLSAQLQDKDWQLFRFMIKIPGVYDFSVDSSILPTNINGSILFPEKIILIEKRNGVQKDLLFSENLKHSYKDENWLIFPMSFEGDGEYDALFIFPPLPNLLQSIQATNIASTTGIKPCIGGEVSYVSSDKLYKLDFRLEQENQNATLLVMEDDLRSENLLPDTTFGPRIYNYTYTPYRWAKARSLFICGTSSVPAISGFRLRDKLDLRTVLVSQNMISADKSTKTPSLTIEKINPTRYHITIQASQKPFILVFNERFNFLWKLYDAQKYSLWFPTSLYDSSHFKVNGFANGWIFDKSNGYDLVLEYAPQQKVDQGKLVTAITFALVVIYFSYWLWKQRRKYE